MSDTVQIIISVLVLALAYVGTRIYMMRKIAKAANFILQDLRDKNAFSDETSVWLPYAKVNWMRIGFKDYRPRAVNALIREGVVVRTPDERYYIALDPKQQIQG